MKNLVRKHVRNVDGTTTVAETVGLTSSVRPVTRKDIQQKSVSTLLAVSTVITVDIRHTSAIIWNKIGELGHLDG